MAGVGVEVLKGVVEVDPDPVVGEIHLGKI